MVKKQNKDTFLWYYNLHMILWAINGPLSYDLTPFQILGQKFAKYFVGILVQTMTSKGHFEICFWDLLTFKLCIWHDTICGHQFLISWFVWWPISSARSTKLTDRVISCSTMTFHSSVLDVHILMLIWR